MTLETYIKLYIFSHVCAFLLRYLIKWSLDEFWYRKKKRSIFEKDAQKRLEAQGYLVDWKIRVPKGYKVGNPPLK